MKWIVSSTARPRMIPPIIILVVSIGTRAQPINQAAGHKETETGSLEARGPAGIV